VVFMERDMEENVVEVVIDSKDRKSLIAGAFRIVSREIEKVPKPLASQGMSGRQTPGAIPSLQCARTVHHFADG